MYKALLRDCRPIAPIFCRSCSRRPRPAGLDTSVDAAAAVRRVRRGRAGLDALPEEPRGDQGAPDERRGFAMGDSDAKSLEYIYSRVLRRRAADQLQLPSGGGGGGFGRGNMPTYATLQVATDSAGKNWAYLATEANYRWLKDFEIEESARAGRRRLRRAEGDSRRRRSTSRSTTRSSAAFYTSNVEQYLFQQDDEW